MSIENKFKEYSAGDVGDYYDQSTKLYSLLWSDKESLAMHFGYWDKDTKNKLEALTNPYREIVKILKPGAGDVLLDSGCGMGGATFWIARNTEAKIIGITISKKQVEIAKKLQKTTKADVASRTEFRYMDYVKTDFKNETFDGIFGVESFSTSYNNLKVIFGEMHRILKKGGKIVIVDGVLNRYPKNKEEKKLLQEFFHGWKLSGGLTAPEIIGYFKEAGFKNIGFIDKTEAIRKSASHLYSIALVGYPFLKLLNFLGVISDVVFDNVYPAIHQKKLQDLGIMGHGVIYAEK